MYNRKNDSYRYMEDLGQERGFRTGKWIKKKKEN